MIKAHLGAAIDTWLQQRAGAALRRAPSPVWWSGAGVLFSCVAGGLFAAEAWRPGALWIAAGALCDLLDGPVARAQGRASPFGAFLDSTCDRAADLAIYLGLMIGVGQGGDLRLLALACVALAAAVLTSYVKARAEHWLASLEGGALERGERLAVLGVGTFFGWIEAALWVLAVVGVWTVAVRFRRVWIELGAPR